MSLLASIDFSSFVHAFALISHSVGAIGGAIGHAVTPLYHAIVIN